MDRKAYQLSIILPRPAHTLDATKVYAHVVGDDGRIERPVYVADGRASVGDFVKFCFHSYMIRGVWEQTIFWRCFMRKFLAVLPAIVLSLLSCDINPMTETVIRDPVTVRFFISTF